MATGAHASGPIGYYQIIMHKVSTSFESSSSSNAQWMAVRGTFAAFCAALVGLGLARFAYTPLLPAIVDAHWFSASAAAYFSAANLTGYLIGALIASPLAARYRAASILRVMMVLVTVSLLACAWPVSLSWFFAWRSLAGLAGGVLMVLAAPTVLPHVPVQRRGLAGGVIFMGVGVAIAGSGLVEPKLIERGVGETWLALGFMSLILTILAWMGWPRSATQASGARGTPVRSLPNRALRAVYLEYALNAVGLVPHMIFLVDFVARGLGMGLETGAVYWTLYGVGAIFGPLLTGFVADRVGFRAAMRIGFVIQASAMALPALGLVGPWLMVSSLIMGAYAPGIVGLVLGRLHDLLGDDHEARRLSWSKATTGFAILQAAAAYGLSFLLQHNGGYSTLFGIGAIAIVAALLVDLVPSRGA